MQRQPVSARAQLDTQTPIMMYNCPAHCTAWASMQILQYGGPPENWFYLLAQYEQSICARTKFVWMVLYHQLWWHYHMLSLGREFKSYHLCSNYCSTLIIELTIILILLIKSHFGIIFGVIRTSYRSHVMPIMSVYSVLKSRSCGHHCTPALECEQHAWSVCLYAYRVSELTAPIQTSLFSFYSLGPP